MFRSYMNISTRTGPFQQQYCQHLPLGTASITFSCILIMFDSSSRISAAGRLADICTLLGSIIFLDDPFGEASYTKKATCLVKTTVWQFELILH
jgi:hypothetical protein